MEPIYKGPYRVWQLIKANGNDVVLWLDGSGVFVSDKNKAKVYLTRIAAEHDTPIGTQYGQLGKVW